MEAQNVYQWEERFTKTISMLYSKQNLLIVGVGVMASLMNHYYGKFS